jgi:hypothetical protein
MANATDEVCAPSAGACNPLVYEAEQGFGVWPLHWDRDESRSCVGQAVITNGTDHVWISCSTYLLRGRIVRDGRNNNKKPVSLVIETMNSNALAGPRQDFAGNSTTLGYGHIGDGDYMEELDEVWFGLEDGNWPRALNAAIVRYDASTLEYKGMHVHPTQKFLAWVVFDQRNQRVYGSDWEGVQDLTVFDTRQMKWLTQNLTIRMIPAEYISLGGMNYIQGGDMQDDTLYLMTDDFRSSLFAILIDSSQNELGGEVVHISHLGLGNEREGIALLDDAAYVLSLGNRWRTWENHSFSELLCLPLRSPHQEEVSPLAIGRISFLIAGFVCGVATSWLASRCAGHKFKRERHTYIEVPTGFSNHEGAFIKPPTLTLK